MRAALGSVFVISGLGKFGVGPKSVGGIGNFAGFLASLGVPLPEVFAWIVGLVELFGGLLLLVGLFTRYAAAFIAVDMFVAMMLVHIPNGFAVGNNGIEYVLTLMLVSVAVVFSGPGRLALEYALFGRELLPGARSDDPVETPIRT